MGQLVVTKHEVYFSSNPGAQTLTLAAGPGAPRSLLFLPGVRLTSLASAAHSRTPLVFASLSPRGCCAALARAELMLHVEMAAYLSLWLSHGSRKPSRQAQSNVGVPQLGRCVTHTPAVGVGVADTHHLTISPCSMKFFRLGRVCLKSGVPRPCWYLSCNGRRTELKEVLADARRCSGR